MGVVNKLPICVTRCGNFFGGGDLHFNRIIPETIKSVLSNENPIIRSNGKFIRDYIYVKDVANAYTCLAEKMDDKNVTGECFNFSTDKPYSVIEIVNWKTTNTVLNLFFVWCAFPLFSTLLGLK